MIYVLHGSDILTIRSRARDLVSSLLLKKPDTVHVRITPERVSPGVFEELLGSRGLFSDKLIVELDGLCSIPEACLEEYMPQFKDSEYVFIVIEEGVEVKMLKVLKDHAHKIENHELVQSVEREPTLFALADALGMRDKKKLWVEYTQAILNDTAPEEIHGMLFWQVKSMIIASCTTEKESGLKPFVYGKSKRYGNNFKKGELESLSSSLVSLYHDARRGLTDFGLALEQWVLSI